MDHDTEELAARAAAGDEQAVEALLVRYLPSLRAFMRARMAPSLRAKESSSDLVQSVCREVLTHIERFQHPSEGAFKHWLFTTAERKLKNRARDLGRLKREARREVPLEPTRSTEDGLLGELYARISSPSRALGRREVIERVEGAIDRLTEEQREVFLLAHLVGLSRKEIGERLGKNETAVRALLHRATARLSILLGEAEG